MSALALPHCAACGAFHYPRREACPHCLAVPTGPMASAPASPHGRIASATRIHVSLDPAFAGRLPVAIGAIAMAAGPVVIAFLEEGLGPGDAVTLHVEPGADGGPVFVARARVGASSG